MPFGSAGYDVKEFPQQNRNIITEECDFYLLRKHARAVIPEHKHERFLNDFYGVVLEEPRDYSVLGDWLRGTVAVHDRTLPEDITIEELCQRLWDDIGSTVEISGAWYSTFMKHLFRALRSCPPAERVRYV